MGTHYTGDDNFDEQDKVFFLFSRKLNLYSIFSQNTSTLEKNYLSVSVYGRLS